MKLEKEEEREGEMMRRKVVIRFPIDPMSEALVEVNQTIKASAELVAKETAIERVPVVEEEAKVDKEDEGQTRELRGQSSFVPGLFQKTFDTSSYLLKWSREIEVLHLVITNPGSRHSGVNFPHLKVAHMSFRSTLYYKEKIWKH